MVKQVEQENKKLERAPAQSLTDNTMRNTMRRAIHASTYERFRHRTLNDSDEELAGTNPYLIIDSQGGYTVLVSPELMQTVVFPPKIFPLKLKTHTFKFPPIQIFRTYFPNHYFPLHLFPNTFMQTEVKYLAKKEIKQPVIVPSPFMLFSVITTPLQLHFVKTLRLFCMGIRCFAGNHLSLRQASNLDLFSAPKPKFFCLIFCVFSLSLGYFLSTKGLKFYAHQTYIWHLDLREKDFKKNFFGSMHFLSCIVGIFSAFMQPISPKIFRDFILKIQF